MAILRRANTVLLRRRLSTANRRAATINSSREAMDSLNKEGILVSSNMDGLLPLRVGSKGMEVRPLRRGISEPRNDGVWTMNGIWLGKTGAKDWTEEGNEKRLRLVNAKSDWLHG